MPNICYLGAARGINSIVTKIRKSAVSPTFRRGVLFFNAKNVNYLNIKASHRTVSNSQIKVILKWFLTAAGVQAGATKQFRNLNLQPSPTDQLTINTNSSSVPGKGNHKRHLARQTRGKKQYLNHLQTNRSLKLTNTQYMRNELPPV